MSIIIRKVGSILRKIQFIPVFLAFTCFVFLIAPIQVANSQAVNQVRQRGFQMTNKTFAPYEEECSSCHMAYPPALLPKRSWIRIMDNLDDHFGQNAALELDPKAMILKHLEGFSADSPKASIHSRRLARMIPVEDEPLRITDTFFWRRKHGGLKAYVWKRASIESRANCVACHKEADIGIFWDKTVKIPKD